MLGLLLLMFIYAAFKKSWEDKEDCYRYKESWLERND